MMAAGRPRRRLYFFACRSRLCAPRSADTVMLAWRRAAAHTIMTAMTDALSEEVKAEWCKKIPLRRGGTPEDVANIATFLASDMSSYVSGQVIQVDGGMNM